jgi:hypothetical protein
MKKRTQHLIFALSALGILLGAEAYAQPYIYPGKGQSQEQQDRDKYECHNWAMQQTGFDPTAPSYATTPPPPKREAPQGGLLQGGARGAALGAVGGAIAGNPGKGAAIGAATGAMVGGMRRSDQLRREDQQQRDVAAQGGAPSTQGRANYERAQRACLEGRGYTVQ